MTPRKKWGIAAIITGVLFVAVGIIVLATVVTPAWLLIAISAISGVADIVGLTLLAIPTPP